MPMETQQKHLLMESTSVHNLKNTECIPQYKSYKKAEMLRSLKSYQQYKSLNRKGSVWHSHLKFGRGKRRQVGKSRQLPVKTRIYRSMSRSLQDEHCYSTTGTDPSDQTLKGMASATEKLSS